MKNSVTRNIKISVDGLNIFSHAQNGLFKKRFEMFIRSGAMIYGLMVQLMNSQGTEKTKFTQVVNDTEELTRMLREAIEKNCFHLWHICTICKNQGIVIADINLLDAEGNMTATDKEIELAIYRLFDEYKNNRIAELKGV